MRTRQVTIGLASVCVVLGAMVAPASGGVAAASPALAGGLAAAGDPWAPQPIPTNLPDARPYLAANLSSGTASVGDTVVATVSGFAPGERVQAGLYLGGEEEAYYSPLGSCVANRLGICSLTVIPNGTWINGPWWFVFFGPKSGQFANMQMQLVVGAQPADCVPVGDVINPDLDVARADPLPSVTVLAGAASIDVGYAFEFLHGQVDVVMSDGSRQTRMVTWPAVGPQRLAQPGSFVIEGTLLDRFPGENPTKVKAAVRINVVDKNALVQPLQDFDVATLIGQEPVFPYAVDGTYDGSDPDGNPVHRSLGLAWDAIDPAVYAKAGVYAVQGHAVGLPARTITARVHVFGDDPLDLMYSTSAQVRPGEALDLLAGDRTPGESVVVYLRSLATGTDVELRTVVVDGFGQIDVPGLVIPASTADGPYIVYAIPANGGRIAATQLLTVDSSLAVPAPTPSSTPLPTSKCGPTPSGTKTSATAKAAASLLPQTGAGRDTGITSGLAVALTAGGSLVLVLLARRMWGPGRHARQV